MHSSGYFGSGVLNKHFSSIGLVKADRGVLQASTSTFVVSRVFQPEGGGGGGWVLPYKRLMGMCRWMGSHFYDWIDYNGVAFLFYFYFIYFIFLNFAFWINY